jgi:predicted DNA-binding transcriptional regulator YafY
VERLPDGSVILEIEVVINHELERVFFGYANGIQVLYPQTLVELIEKKLRRAVEQYEKPK